MTEEQRKKCHTIIHSASLAASAVGAVAVLPASDSVCISAVQLSMTLQIASVFGAKLSQSTATATLATASATIIGRNVAAFFCSFVPVLGNVVNAITGAAVTELIGWAIANNFDSH